MTTRRRFFRLPWRTARQIRRDVDDELRFHLDMRVEALFALGVARDEAHRRALAEFGDMDDARRYIGAVDRDIEAAQRRSDFMSDLWHDIGYGARKLRAAPLFTLAAIVTLALGIGANTAIFSVVNGVLLKPLPFRDPARLVLVSSTNRDGKMNAMSALDYIDYRDQSHGYVGMAQMDVGNMNLARSGTPPTRAAFRRCGGIPVRARFTLPTSNCAMPTKPWLWSR